MIISLQVKSELVQGVFSDIQFLSVGFMFVFLRPKLFGNCNHNKSFAPINIGILEVVAEPGFDPRES